ncbi:hypothetical protein TI04_01640 [Achromatium sp. WMS2]|nr:hypothetical protein TI04_01640 [Achromatium sp. WMS2]
MNLIFAAEYSILKISMKLNQQERVMKKLASGLLLGLAALSNLSYAEPLTMQSIGISDRHSTCISKAKRGMRAANLANIEHLNDYYVFGSDSPYYAGILCRADVGLVFLTVSGPNSSERSNILRRLANQY